MAKHGLWIGALFGLLGVFLGTFGAHGLEQVLGEHEAVTKRLAQWETAIRYLMYHSAVLLVIGMMGQFNRAKLLEYSMWCLSIGTALFSGLLCVYVLTDLAFLAMIMPLGGVLMILGWAMLMIAGWVAAQPKKKKK